MGLNLGNLQNGLTAMKVHIVLKDSVLEDEAATRRVVQNLVREVDLRDVNERRVSRYGIVTGEIDPSMVKAVLNMDEVEAVEADEVKFAI